jgi:copper(I)-binding protein
MKPVSRHRRAYRIFAAGLLAQSLLAGAAVPAHAQQQTAPAPSYKIGTIEISQPWTRATPKGAAVAGGYLKITNSGTSADRLVGGTSPIAGRVDMHEMKEVNSVMQMRPLARGLEIKAGETVEFKPGSYHLMFMNLKRPLVQGERIKGTLNFENAGSVEVEFPVGPIAGQAPAAAQGHYGH